MMIASTISLGAQFRNFKDWENLCRNLDQQSADDLVGDGDFVDIAPL